jgi:hypothetical protein
MFFADFFFAECFFERQIFAEFSAAEKKEIPPKEARLRAAGVLAIRFSY